ncbi:MAG: M55 family metallopeptidase [Gemmatimonadales bacterium]|nr:M55 family metallopeptidase [Gemmatimonadales bacterium]
MRTPLLLLLAPLVACAPSSPSSSGSSGAPWNLETVRADTTDGIRILVLHDMEGLSGQTDPGSFRFGHPLYPTGQEMLAADVNAVVAGLYAGGATEVFVVDGHGSGNADPDLRRDLLDPRVQQIMKDAPFDAYFDLVTPKAYDAVAVVGMHSKTGSRGFAAHTFTLGIGILINGQPITETELVALSWGRQGIPVIFASGDDRLADDLKTMPWIEYVTVKTATAADSADPRPVEEARADLTAHAQKAVENLRVGKAQAMRVPGKLRAGLKAVPPASLAMFDGIPGIPYSDSTLFFEADSLRHAYDILVQLIGVATSGSTAPLTRALAADSAGARLLRDHNVRRRLTWFDYESGRWQPTPPPPGITEVRRGHGYR